MKKSILLVIAGLGFCLSVAAETKAFRCRKALPTEYKIEEIHPQVEASIRQTVADLGLAPQVADVRLAVLGLHHRMATITTSKGHYMRFFHEMDDWLRNFQRMDSNHLLPTMPEFTQRFLDTMAANVRVNTAAASADADKLDQYGVSKRERAELFRESQVSTTLEWLRVVGWKRIRAFEAAVQKNESALAQQITGF